MGGHKKPRFWGVCECVCPGEDEAWVGLAASPVPVSRGAAWSGAAPIRCC